MKIPILTYHALNAPGWNYTSNDHVALESDLKTIRKLGFRIAPLALLASRLRSGSLIEGLPPLVGISFDDGTDHDFYDFSHPDYGHLKSMSRVMREGAFDLAHGGGQANATSFVIASPEARLQLDRSCIAERSQWRDCWWFEANESGVISIGNHSWDHLHVSLEQVAHHANAKGSFEVVQTKADAIAQIADAQNFIDSRLRQNSCRLFAYPYGHTNSFLTEEYFPSQNLVNAAFCTGGEYLTEHSSVWAIPRFVCQQDWSHPDQLAYILRTAQNG